MAVTAHTRPAAFGYVALLGGVLIHLCLGSFYFWGNFTTYATSTMRVEHPSLTYKDTIVCYLISPAVLGCVLFTTLPALQLIGHRALALVGTVIIGCLYFCSSAIHHGLPAMLVAYGGVFGVAQGVLYTIPMSAALTYLPDRPGVITGVITLGFGLGAFFLNFVVSAYLNPHNCSPVCPGPDRTYPDFVCPGYVSNASTGVLRELTCKGNEKYFPPDSDQVTQTPDFFHVMALSLAVLCFLGSLLMVPQGVAFLPWVHCAGGERKQLLGDEEDATQSAPSLSGRETEEPALPKWNTGMQFTATEMMQTQMGWRLFIGFFLTAAPGVFFIGNYKSLGQGAAWSTDSKEASISSAIAISNGLGRLAQGLLCDVFGWTKVLSAASFCTAVLIITVNFTTENEYFFTVWCVAIAFVYGGNYAIYPTAVATTFGAPHFPTNYGVVFVSFGFGSLAMGLLNEALVDHIGHWGMCAIFGGLALLGGGNAVNMHFKVRRLLASRGEAAIGSTL
eukprot:TRINITY_DN4501_c0_g1_i1.p1 TRINITY_DN4501_c0_g1~~TRINITY_DN4501_c0_g1_i1.p1  ORF type:complete len:505 (+),score=128.40 TRINITY_DN4501_c0_g1_i1:176-1690(+)